MNRYLEVKGLLRNWRHNLIKSSILMKKKKLETKDLSYILYFNFYIVIHIVYIYKLYVKFNKENLR